MVSRKRLICFSFLFLALTAFVSAQEGDLESAVDYKVQKMKKELKLTDAQADAVGPVIKEYLAKRNAFLQEINSQGIIDHVAVKGGLKKLKENEYQALSKILSEDQMKSWVNKENLMASLNPDGSGGGAVDDETTGITPEGANFKF